MQAQPHIIQIHILRSLPTNLANSGQDGGPKELPFGGSRRLRLSSQSIKSRLRASTYFREGSIPMATRTTALPELVRRELQEMGADETMTEAIVAKMVDGMGKNEKSKKKAEADEVISPEGELDEVAAPVEQKQKYANTKAAYLIAEHEPRDIARHFAHAYNTLGPAKFGGETFEAMAASFRTDGPLAADAALFGRFSTSGVLVTMEAAASFAHAFTTNATRPQIDWFVAREETELGDRANPMAGDQPYGSGCYVSYANIDLGTLLDNLQGDAELTKSVVAAFVSALTSSQAVPAGKQHGMAAPTLPDLVLFEAVYAPVFYGSAFEKPVRADGDLSLAEASAERLRAYIEAADKFRAPNEPPIERRVLSMLPNWQSDETMSSLVEWLSGFVPEGEEAKA